MSLPTPFARMVSGSFGGIVVPETFTTTNNYFLEQQLIFLLNQQRINNLQTTNSIMWNTAFVDHSFPLTNRTSILSESMHPTFATSNHGHHISVMLKNNETLPDEDLINSFSSSSKNKLGRTYNPGRPLAMIDRHRILELYEKGHKISHIARIIGVTHSCVSKIMSRFRRTGSMCPRSTQYKKQFDINNNCTKQIILTSPSGSSFSGESFTSRESLSSSTSLTPAIIHKPIPLKNLYTVERILD